MDPEDTVERKAALALQEVNRNLSLSRELSVRLASMAAQAQATRALLEAAIEASGGPTRRQRKRSASPGLNASLHAAQRRCLAGPNHTLMPDSASAATDTGPAGASCGSAEKSSSPPTDSASEVASQAATAPVRHAAAEPLLFQDKETAMRSLLDEESAADHRASQKPGPEDVDGGGHALGHGQALAAADGGPLAVGCGPWQAQLQPAPALLRRPTSTSSRPPAPRLTAGTPTQPASMTVAAATAPAVATSGSAEVALRLQVSRLRPEHHAEIVNCMSPAGLAALQLRPSLHRIPDHQQQHQQQPQAPDTLRIGGASLSVGVPAAAGCQALSHGCGGGAAPGSSSRSTALELTATVAAAAFLSGGGGSSSAPPLAPGTPRKAQAAKARSRAARAATAADSVTPASVGGPVGAAHTLYCTPTPAVPAFAAAAAAAWRHSFESLKPVPAVSSSGCAGTATLADLGRSLSVAADGSGRGLDLGHGDAARGGTCSATPGAKPRLADGFLVTHCGSLRAALAQPRPLVPAPPLPPPPPVTGPLPLREEMPYSLSPPVPLPSGPGCAWIATCGSSVGGGGITAPDSGGGETPDVQAEPVPPAPPDNWAGPGVLGVPPAVARDLGAALSSRF
ncbi:hypothetical protein PLESTB_000571500 [Pleodorina starrii]|uniref:Uncharacterized protein n=1 Tax=Pleodorina starrii TaxID=330485 RepID=A0A9W6BH83_9CHLO|nr:hypothetical protein PLESTM_000313300 [Pleodorina starrii]GLC51999.1 hypothetical protein PLESTB_000571500 [Pleodorina starrii]GLC72140.1 hypothetical protein PLESTF_001211400 [Pleodorina starrii]